MLGINIGSQNTIFSTCGTDTNGKFTTQTLLSDTSDRTLPSIISFTPKNRKVGVTAENDVKKNPDSSFIYVQRYIGLIPNTPFFEKELKYSISQNFHVEENKFNFDFGGKSNYLIGDDIVAGFIDKVMEAYAKNNENINYDEMTISIPDFFTPLQRDSIYLILKSNGIKIPHIINESTAITLFYGYNHYISLFKNNASTNVKNVIFVDIGHAKTTFFLSQFKFNEFKVLYVKSIPFLGGRDFDEAIFKYAQMQFLLKFQCPFPDNPKYKLNLMEAIIKQRKQLTVNKEVTVTIESIKNDEDFSFVLTRDLFHSIIAPSLQEFSSKYMEFLDECKEIIPLEQINAIEMAGELLRTPILQDIVTKLTQIKEVSKTILVDECTSTGAALFTAYAMKKFPIKHFQFLTGYNMYDIFYTIDGDSKTFTPLLNPGSQLPISESITIRIHSGNLTKSVIDFYYNKDNLEDFSKSEHLIQYTFDLRNIKKNNPNFSSSNNILKLFFIVRQSGFIKFHKIENGAKEELKFNENNVIQSKSGIYKNKEDEEDAILGLTTILNEHDEIDEKAAEMENKKIELSKNFYQLKNEMKKMKELNENTQRGRELVERMNLINKKIHDLNKYNIKRQESGLRRINSIKQHLLDVQNDYDLEFK